MLVPNGPRWFDRQRPERSWPSIVVAIGLTFALFATAFVAMQTVNGWQSGARSAILERPIVVRLTPPVAPLPPAERRPRPPVPQPAPRAIAAPLPGVSTPLAPAAPPATAPPIAVPPAQRAAAPAPGADTAGGRVSNASAIPLGPIAFPKGLPDTAMGARGGAPSTRAGVTIESRHPNTAAYRDSVLTERLRAIPGSAMDHPATGRELAEMQRSRANAAAMSRRATTSGNPDVHVMTGDGVDGVGAVGGSSATSGNRSLTSGSVGLPLLSSGPSAAERKRNEALDADYKARLRRLDDRIRLKRDSLRADSLRARARADSLAKAVRP